MREYVILGNAIMHIDAESEDEALILAEEADMGEWEINDMAVADLP